jgi:peroxiredoxin Q/BCP
MPARKAAEAPAEGARRSSRLKDKPAPPPKPAPKPRGKKRITKDDAEKKDDANSPMQVDQDEHVDKKAKTDASDSKADEPMAQDDKENKAPEAAPKEFAIGDVLPAMTLNNEKGEPIEIGGLAKEKGVVLFLVPKADTSGCTTQACGFRDNYSEFQKFGYDVYCLSADPSDAQAKWQSKKELPYTLISDPERQLVKALGAHAPIKSPTKRSHFIFEKGTGKLIEKQLGVKPAESPNDALEFVKKHHA